jgi:hypothetical protein
MGNLQEDLLAPKHDEEAPSAPGPYQGDNIIQFPKPNEEEEPKKEKSPSTPTPKQEDSVIEFPKPEKKAA